MNQPLPNLYMSAKQLSCTYGDPFIAYCHMKHKQLMPHGQSALRNKRSLEFFLLQVKCRLICIALAGILLLYAFFRRCLIPCIQISHSDGPFPSVNPIPY